MRYIDVVIYDTVQVPVVTRVPVRKASTLNTQRGITRKRAQNKVVARRGGVFGTAKIGKSKKKGGVSGGASGSARFGTEVIYRQRELQRAGRKAHGRRRPVKGPLKPRDTARPMRPVQKENDIEPLVMTTMRPNTTAKKGTKP